MRAHELLKPLQQTADRVSRQVEEFAKCLDKFNESRSPTDQSLWEDAGRLLGKYSDIAVTRKRQATAAQQGSRASSHNRKSLGDGENEIQQVQLEADLWTLMGALLDCKSPKALSDAKDVQKTALESLHRYSTDVEIWTAFISSDTFAQERQEILGWLQNTAAAAKTTIDQVISELTGKAQRGDGIWSAGWLFTKMTIKTQKRSRSWSKPLDPSNSGIHVSLRRATDSKPLVTQMDPDASTREGNVLEPQDEFHEQAAWQACWETLRRGLNPKVCREWWSERKEVWRAAATRGADPDFVKHKDSQWFRIINLASNTEWLERCKFLSQDGVIVNPYQAAVYGVLSGDLTAPLKVCHTIDDHLFAHFNGLLIQQYREFLRAYRHKLEKHNKGECHPQSPTYESVRQYLVYAETDGETKAESRSPHKTIEAAIVSNDFDTFLIRQGQALGQIPGLEGIYLDLLVQDQNAPVGEAAQATAENPDSLRMIVHLQLLLKALGYLGVAYETSMDIMENNIASYIGWLQIEGKFALTPLYASKLSPDRAARTMGAIALDVTDPAERDLQVKLMKHYAINIPDVLDAQFMFANADILTLFTTKPSKLKPASITEYVGSGKVKNIKVKKHFMGDELLESEERAVQSLEWYQYADKQEWGRACWNASSLYKMFIFQGRLVAAKALSVRAPLADISKLALGMDLGSPDVLAEASDGDVEMDGVPHEERSQPISPTRRRKERKRTGVHLLKTPSVTREALAAKAQTWRQLEQLMSALDMMEVWADHAEEVEQ
jgi:nuclear pore complex protein Nup107